MNHVNALAHTEHAHNYAVHAECTVLLYSVRVSRS